MNIRHSVVGVRAVAVTASGIAACVLMLQSGLGSAADIKVLSASAIKNSLEELVPGFEKASGHKIAITYGGGAATAKRAQGGENADIVILPQRDADTLVKGDKVVAGSVVPIAKSQLSMAVRKGVAKPDISTVDAFKRALLAAKSVGYNKPEGSGSGTHFVKILDQLGIAKEINAKAVITEAGGALAQSMSNGKSDVGVTQTSSFVGIAGIEVVGPIPRELQLTTSYVSAILTGAKNVDAAKALVTFLRNAESTKVFKAKGMEPG